MNSFFNGLAKTRQRFLRRSLAIVILLGVLGNEAATASIAYGSINNFDTVNDTGHECHGFEIEIEDCHSTDITYTYNYNHYGVPEITEDDSVAGHPKCLIRWESKKTAGGAWAAHTVIPVGPISPTNGHMFTDPSVNFGGEHFGVGYSVAVGPVHYQWLIDDGAGSLVRGGAVEVSTPTFTYYPPGNGNAAQMQAVIVPPVPPAPEPKEFGKAVWVKEIRTTSHNNKEVKLRHLVSDDPEHPLEKNWKNGEPDEVETEWQILQKDYGKADGGAKNQVPAAAENLPGGDEVVTRRYEFYKYVGPLDAESGEAMAETVAPDGIHGSGVKVINGVSVDLATVVIVGDYTGAQMAAVDVEAPLGLIDHVGEGKVDSPIAARTIVIEGAHPFIATQEGAMPPGIIFNEFNGILSGTPTESGQFQFKISATDGVNPEVVKNYTMAVAPANAELPAASLLDTVALPIEGGTTSGDGSYALNAEATVTAVANAGYRFASWTDNGVVVSTDSTYSLTMDVNHSLIANFVQGRVVTASATPVTGGSTSGSGEYADGETVTMTATSNAGYSFVSWTENGFLVSNSPSFSFSIASDRNLVANFALGQTYLVTTTAAPIAGGTATGGGSVVAGTNATVMAMANAGYAFTNWTREGVVVSNEASYTFQVTAAAALVANFTAVGGGGNRTISTTSSPAAGGATTGGGQFADGASVTVSATPNAGYLFKRWQVNGNSVSTSANYTFTVNGDRALTAKFAVAANILTSAVPANAGSTSGGGLFEDGDNVTVVATANAGATFLNWTENGTVVSTEASFKIKARPDTAPTRNLVANFSAEDNVTIIANAFPEAGGTVTGTGDFAAGTPVTLTAIPNVGYEFINWTDVEGTEFGSSADLSFVAETNIEFVANFAALPTGIRFDFDAATPVLNLGEALPFDQEAAGLVVSISSLPDNDYSIQTEASSGRVLSNFSGNNLEPASDDEDLKLQFNQGITGISIDFATIESLNELVASTVRLTAIDNSSGIPIVVGTAIAHGQVHAGDSLPVGSISFNSADGVFDEVILTLADPLAPARRFLIDNILASPSSSTGGTMLLANPNWNITLTDFGYSDFLLDNTPGFEGREYLSGEWGSAVAYTKGAHLQNPTWLEPNFLFPDWKTNSDFHVVTGIHMVGTNLDGLPIAESVLSNGDLEITLHFEMLDTVVGTPMGIKPASEGGVGSFVNSNRYVLNQTFQIKNISGVAIDNIQLFQLLHGFISQHGQYDNRSYAGKLSQYQYDVTMSGLDAGAAGGQSSTIGLEDLIGFHSKVATTAFELGHYGIEGNGLDDHSMGKPSDGVHLSIEENWQTEPYLSRKGRDAFAPADRWIAGGQRWSLGSLPAGQSVSFDLLLSLLTGTKVVINDTGNGGTSGGGSCNGGSSHVGGVDFEIEDIDEEGTMFGEFSEADDDELLEREEDGDFAHPTFSVPTGGVRQLWKLNYSGRHTGPIRLSLAYDATLLPPDSDENQLAIYHFTNGAWEKLPGTVDPLLHVIRVVTPSLSPFMLGLNSEVVFPKVANSISAGGILTMSWPASFLGWVLEESSDLKEASWTRSKAAVVTLGGLNTVMLPMSENRKFYRLTKP